MPQERLNHCWGPAVVQDGLETRDREREGEGERERESTKRGEKDIHGGKKISNRRRKEGRERQEYLRSKERGGNKPKENKV